MDAQTLLQNISALLQNSNQSQSQQIINKIIQIANRKLLNTNNLNLNQPSQTNSKYINNTKLLKQQFNPSKKKFISKQKLKRYAIQKITSTNKKLHSKFFNESLQQKYPKQIHNCQSLNSFEYLNQEQKVNSEDQNKHIQQQKINPSNKNLNVQEPKIFRAYKEHKLSTQKIHQKFKKTRKNFQNYLKCRSKQSKIQQLTCPVCIQTLIDPVSTLCAHSFCFKCLDQSLLFGSNCPVCRLHIKGSQIIPCPQLRQLIKIKCQQFIDDQSSLENYKVRNQQHNEWKKARFIDPQTLKQDMILDVRDTQHIWCKAKVEKIYLVKGQISSILVHYLQWSKIYDQIIDTKSSRLAPKDHFSSRTDIPRYNLGQQQQNLRGGLVIGGNQSSYNNRGNQLSFSNILQLGGQINSIRSNLDQLMVIPVLSRNNELSININSNNLSINNNNGQGNGMNYLHRNIALDDDSSFNDSDMSENIELMNEQQDIQQDEQIEFVRNGIFSYINNGMGMDDQEEYEIDENGNSYIVVQDENEQLHEQFQSRLRDQSQPPYSRLQSQQSHHSQQQNYSQNFNRQIGRPWIQSQYQSFNHDSVYYYPENQFDNHSHSQ